ncbi:MAG TPA: DUF3467 domain-containing protein [Pirellulales bacterium]|nr:DUF3467 domain-containing protein [Pirellulales bacterium]
MSTDAGSSPSAAADVPPVAVPQTMSIDDSNMIASYSNFCRVTGTPEELIVDFGTNPSPFEYTPEPVVVTQRIVTNFFTAKRMLHALQLTLDRHEAAFGVIEPDVQRRAMDAQHPQAHR